MDQKAIKKELQGDLRDIDSQIFKNEVEIKIAKDKLQQKVKADEPKSMTKATNIVTYDEFVKMQAEMQNFRAEWDEWLRITFSDMDDEMEYDTGVDDSLDSIKDKQAGKIPVKGTKLKATAQAQDPVDIQFHKMLAEMSISNNHNTFK